MKDPHKVPKNIRFTSVLLTVFRSMLQLFPLVFVGFLLLAIGAAILLTAAPRIFQKIVDLVIAGNSLDQFWKLLAGYGLCLSIGSICKFGATKISFYIATQVEDRWRYAGLHHYYQLPFACHDKHDSGEVGTRIDKGGSAIFVLLYELFGQNLLVAILTLLFVVIYTFLILPFFGVLLLLPIPIYIIITFFISRTIALKQASLNRLERTANRALYDGVSNVRTVKAFGKEDQEPEYYAKRWSKYHSFEYGVERLWFTQEFLQTVIEVTLRTALLTYCIYAIYSQQITLGQLILIISYQQMTFAPLAQLNQLFTRLRRNAKRASHLFEIIGEKDVLTDSPDAVSVKPLLQEIVLHNVSFEYTKKTAALYDINLAIPAGTTTALVGRSGAGKSTLAFLLLRFYDPDQGKITYDGTDLRSIQRASLRKQVTWIPQDTSLFNRTMRENIAYGNPKAGQEAIEQAAKLAQAHEFILKTPNGYNSVTGERGVKLSGGQRQRIAIARSLLTKPSILIMDESTSHLDSETEKAISESIQELHHKTTQIIIAHRLSTILHADQIVVLDEGRVVAVGKHQELLGNPIYKRLYELQFQRAK